MAVEISNDTVASLPLTDAEEMGYFVVSTSPGSGLDSSNSIIWNPSQHIYSPEYDLFSLDMLSNYATFEGYNEFNELTTTSFEPFIVTALEHIKEVLPGESTLDMEVSQPSLGSLLSIGNEGSLRENSNTKIKQAVGARIQCPTGKGPTGEEKPRHRATSRKALEAAHQEPSLEDITQLIRRAKSKEEKLELSLQKRRIQNRNAGISYRHRRRVRIEEMQEKIESLIKQTSKLEQENDRLRLEICDLTRRMPINH